MRRIVFALILTAAVHPLAQPAAQQAPAVVRIDAVATDARGRSVQDLRPSEFEVFESGLSRPIESVQFVVADGTGPAGERPPAIVSAETEQVEAAREGTRLFAVFLDEYHVSAGPGVEKARALLTDFIDRRLGPNDLVLIVKPLDSLPRMRLTNDREAIRNAIARFDGRKGDYAPRTAFERQYIAQDADRIVAVRAQIAASALNAIAEHLGGLQIGRKTIIAVTEGFARPARRRGDVGLPSIDVVTRSANRSGVSIYPLDPRALVAPNSQDQPDASSTAASDAAVDVNTLRTLAGDTGGQAILTPADVTPGIERMLSDSRGYYLVAFHPASADENGRFRPIAVTVSRPDITLRTRPGYWEALPDYTVAVKRVESAVPLLQSHVSTLIRPWFGFTRAADGKTRVQYVWEPAGRIPGDRSRSSGPVRTILTAFDRKGTVVVERTVPLQSESSTFELEPGTFQVRLRIEDAASGVLDTDVRQLVVAPLSGPLVLGTLQVLRARTVREFRELSENPSPVPVVVRQFSRTERLLIRVPVYSSDLSFTDVTARLVSGRGQVMREIDVSPRPGPDLFSIDLPLAGLASGEYRLDIFARNADLRAQDSVTFRVTP